MLLNALSLNVATVTKYRLKVDLSHFGVELLFNAFPIGTICAM